MESYNMFMGQKTLLRCQFSPRWFIDSKEFQSKTQQVFLVETGKVTKICVEMQKA